MNSRRGKEERFQNVSCQFRNKEVCMDGIAHLPPRLPWAQGYSLLCFLLQPRGTLASDPAPEPISLSVPSPGSEGPWERES